MRTKLAVLIGMVLIMTATAVTPASAQTCTGLTCGAGGGKVTLGSGSFVTTPPADLNPFNCHKYDKPSHRRFCHLFNP